MLAKREVAMISFFASICLGNNQHTSDLDFGCKKVCKSRNYLIYILRYGGRERGIGYYANKFAPLYGESDSNGAAEERIPYSARLLPEQ